MAAQRFAQLFRVALAGRRPRALRMRVAEAPDRGPSAGRRRDLGPWVWIKAPPKGRKQGFRRPEGREKRGEREQRLPRRAHDGSVRAERVRGQGVRRARFY